MTSLACVSCGSAGTNVSPGPGGSPRRASTLATPSRSIQLRMCRVSSGVFAHVRCAIASMWYWRLILVTSSSVCRPVRSRYVTDTQSGAWPAKAETVRSRTSTSASSRGAMNSNEIVGRPRASSLAMRIWVGTLPEDPRISDAAGDSLRVEMFEQRQHRTPARAHAVAQLRDGDRTGGRDDLPYQRDRRCICVLGERQVVAH